MTEDDLLAPLRQFKRHTEDLLALARADDWAAFEQLSPNRQALLPLINDNEFLIAVAKAERAEEMRKLIGEIQALNDELTELAERAKSQAANTLKDEQVKQKAVKAYQSE